MIEYIPKAGDCFMLIKLCKLKLTLNISSSIVSLCDACHGKTDLKVFVVVISKKGLAGWGPADPSLGITQTTEYNL